MVVQPHPARRSAMNPSAELEAALEAAAARGGHRALAVPAQSRGAHQGGQDRRSPRRTCAARSPSGKILESRFPAYGFYGEETGPRDLSAESVWLVDPIDGTKAFVREYPMFSTQIALMRGGEIVLGVSSAPVYGELAYAERGAGAYLNGRPLRVSDIGTIAASGALVRELEVAGGERSVAALRAGGGRGQSHPRLWRFPALPFAGGRQDRCRDGKRT